MAAFRDLFELMVGTYRLPKNDDVDVSSKANLTQDVDRTFAQQIQPLMLASEQSRMTALDKLRSRTMIACISLLLYYFTLVIFAFRLWGDDSGVWSWLLGLMLVPLFFVLTWVMRPVNDYKKNIKVSIFPKIFKIFGDGFVYNPKNRMSLHSLLESKIIPSYRRARLEDYVQAQYKGVDFEMCEAHLQDVKSDGDGGTRTITVFRGLFVLFESHKDFFGRTVVSSDKGSVGNWLTERFSRELERVSLEDPEFERLFQVYGTDQVESRYLLTTSFMQRLLDLSILFKNAKIQVSFYQNKLLLMIPSRKNFFEVNSIFQQLSFEQDIQKILKEMELLFSIVDTLKLNEKTGL